MLGILIASVKNELTIRALLAGPRTVGPPKPDKIKPFDLYISH